MVTTLSIEVSASSQMSTRSSVIIRHNRMSRKARHARKAKRSAPAKGEVIFAPSAGKLDKTAVFKAAMIRNRAVLEELAKH